ncbi:MAG: thiamine pyrophosphate-dependent dehydrogenase E1 component subunit alpha [Bacteroidales bacterium]|nr:thiamine pyrophosphate-dependent dehydrogenase E1 component subunit alpha [Bacteroidales bacterium]
MDKKEMLYKMLLIRKMEQKIESLFSLGLLRGTTHCCIGQEGVPAVLSDLIDIEKDYLCSGHRAHGLSMMMTGQPETLLGEIMGKPFGMAKGLGGSQHVYYKNYYTNGITGGMTPVTAGIGFALKHEDTDAIACVVIGDGAMNEGYVLESFNLIQEMNLPVLIILENNGYAMSTPIETVNPYSTFEDRVKGFKLPYSLVSAADFDNLYDTLKTAVEKVRMIRGPQFVEVFTHRFCGHSKSDNRYYIPVERDEYWNEHDTIKSLANELSKNEVAEITAKVEARVEECYQYCVNN